MSVIEQGILIIAAEIIVLLCGILLFKHKDADTVIQFCGLFCIIGISFVIFIEIGLSISYLFAVNNW